MPGSSNDHLSEDELNGYAEGDADLVARLTAHLEVCPPCQALANEYRRQQRGLNSFWIKEMHSPGSDCPDPNDWWKVARGLISREDAGSRLAHAASCGHCGRILRQTIDDIEADVVIDESFIASLPSSTPDRIRQQATRFAQAARTPAVPSHRRIRRGWLVAAAVVIATGVGLLTLRPTSINDVNRLLAQGYGQSRPSELRFPGALHGPIRQERGSASGRPRPIIEAEVAISKQLSRNPADSNWLRLQGRELLFQWRYEEAIASLSRAKTLAPADPAIGGDLAAAYFERAQARGDSADYRAALDLLSASIEREPNVPELRFNRAIVLDHLSLNARAVEEWGEFLKLEPTGGWADEARTRLAESQGKTF